MDQFSYKLENSENPVLKSIPYSNDRIEIKTEPVEDVEIKLEDLHYSIDIKDEPSRLVPEANANGVSRFKKCFIPRCGNTTYNSEKIFFTVPRDPVIRKLWAQAAGIPPPIYIKSYWNCCDDHFDVETDFKNWIYFKTLGSKLKIKNGVLPHKFIHDSPVEPKITVTLAERTRKLENIRNFKDGMYS